MEAGEILARARGPDASDPASLASHDRRERGAGEAGNGLGTPADGAIMRFVHPREPPRFAVDEDTVPEFQHEQREDLFAVEEIGAAVHAAEAADGIPLEVATAADGGFGEALVGGGSARAGGEILVEGDVEGLFGAAGDVGHAAIGEVAAQEEFAGGAAAFEARGHAGEELDEAVIHERDAAFDGVGHGHFILLHEDVVRKPVGVLQAEDAIEEIAVDGGECPVGMVEAASWARMAGV